MNTSSSTSNETAENLEEPVSSRLRSKSQNAAAAHNSASSNKTSKLAEVENNQKRIKRKSVVPLSDRVLRSRKLPVTVTSPTASNATPLCTGSNVPNSVRQPSPIPSSSAFHRARSTSSEGMERTLMQNADGSAPKQAKPSEMLTTSSFTSTTLPLATSEPNGPTVPFYKPSSLFLTECCEKVGIEYQDEAYNFWSEIKIDKVSSASTPKTVHSTSESVHPGYDCLSILLTGAEKQAQQIREKINQYIYEQNSESGLPINRETEGRALHSPSITEYHLPWIAELFECRIGIFASNVWKRYGNWELNDGTPIILLEYKNLKYSPIMTFN